VWKVGSGAHLLPPLPLDPLDPLDPVENSETSIFDNPSVDFGQKAGKARPKIASGLTAPFICIFEEKKRPARVPTPGATRFSLKRCIFEGKNAF